MGDDDARLLTDKARNNKPAEILEQMATYSRFIERYKTDLIGYYCDLCAIRHNPGIADKYIVTSIDPQPELLMMNTYNKMTVGRDKRIKGIIEL